MFKHFYTIKYFVTALLVGLLIIVNFVIFSIAHTYKDGLVYVEPLAFFPPFIMSDSLDGLFFICILIFIIIPSFCGFLAPYKEKRFALLAIIVSASIIGLFWTGSTSMRLAPLDENIFLYGIKNIFGVQFFIMTFILISIGVVGRRVFEKYK